jgi:hypothetical protein
VKTGTGATGQDMHSARSIPHQYKHDQRQSVTPQTSNQSISGKIARYLIGCDVLCQR